MTRKERVIEQLESQGYTVVEIGMYYKDRSTKRRSPYSRGKRCRVEERRRPRLDSPVDNYPVHAAGNWRRFERIGNSPVSMPRVELFPAPLMPKRPKHSPFGMPSDVLFTATFVPDLTGYIFRRPSIYRYVNARSKIRRRRKQGSRCSARSP